MVKVSVIVPVYNSQKYLNECIESILVQTFEDFELVLVNDGSNDNSLEICQSYIDGSEKNKSNRKIVLINKENGGVSEARNSGIEAASGKYLCFVDSDDTVKETYIEELLNEMLLYCTDASFCAHSYNYDGRLIEKLARLKEGQYETYELYNRLFDDGTLTGMLFGSVCGALYKHDIIDENKLRFEKLKRNEDGIFNLMYLLNCSKISAINRSLYYHRIHRKRPNKDNYDSVVEARKALGSILSDSQKTKISFDMQLNRRYVTEAFWYIIKMSLGSSLSMKESVSAIKAKLEDPLVIAGFDFLKNENASTYKRLCIRLMKKKRCCSIYLLIGKIYPVLRNRVSR